MLLGVHILCNKGKQTFMCVIENCRGKKFGKGFSEQSWYMKINYSVLVITHLRCVKIPPMVSLFH